MSLRDYLVDPALPGGRACGDALLWLGAQPADAPAAIVQACPRGDWLLWLAERMRYDAMTLAAAVRPAVLRAARIYAADDCEAAGRADRAERLRALPDDAAFSEIAVAAAVTGAAAAYATARAARAARAAAWWAAAWWAADAADAAWDAEHAMCAEDVRRALPDLGERLVAAVAARVLTAGLKAREHGGER